MNSEDMINFIQSLDGEQKKQFENLFKTMGEIHGVKIKEETKPKEKDNKQKPEDKQDFTMNKNYNNNKRGREPVKFKKNKWVDDGVEFSDVETPKSERSPRNRKKPNKRTVECHVCGKEFQLNSNLIYGEYHRCNRCGRR